MTATTFKPMKPRTPGSLHHALSRAINEVGGLPAAADLIQRQENWVYKAADPDVDERRKATLSYEEARTLSRAGASALAEDLALLAGGFFLPPIPDTAPHALQMAVASYAAESGEALSEILKRAADGDFSARDATASLKEIDDALRALMAIRSIAVSTAAGSNVTPLRAADPQIRRDGDDMVGRIVSNTEKSAALEQGTERMAARPFLGRLKTEHADSLRQAFVQGAKE